MIKWLTFFLLLFSLKLIAQNGYITLTGEIVDNESGETLPFVSIYLEGTSIGTSSNKDGIFEFHIPEKLRDSKVNISMIGYISVAIEPSNFNSYQTIRLKENVLTLSEVIVTAKQLSAKQIIKKAYESLDDNYPLEPYLLEGFVRDLQKEDSTYIELLECAAKFSYERYDVKHEPRVELQAIRRNYITNKHPWNKEWERKNSIADLIEDDFIRFNYGPIKVGRGWKYEIESILPFDKRQVYKIVGVDNPYSQATLYIDVDSYAFVRIEYNRAAKKRSYYKRRLSNGQQEIAYNLTLEYQEYKGKWYLKYQKEEDTWAIFKGLESNKLLFTKYPKKELFINRIITQEEIGHYDFQANLDITKSIENHSEQYNPDFWKNYNAPILTKELSKIEQYLKQTQINVKSDTK